MYLSTGVIQTQAEAEEKIRQPLCSIDRANVETHHCKPYSTGF